MATEEEDIDYVVIKSQSGDRFVVDKRVALLSDTLKTMLDEGGQSTEMNTRIISLDDIASPIVEKVIEYLYFRMRYSKTSGEIPDFKIHPDMAIDVLMAAHYLSC